MTSDDRTFGMLSHLLGIFTGFIGPLVVFLAKGRASPFIRAQSAESLNFQITLVVAYLVAWIVLAIPYFAPATLMLLPVGFFLLFAVWACSLALMIRAAVKANRGQPFRYLINIRMVK